MYVQNERRDGIYIYDDVMQSHSSERKKRDDTHIMTPPNTHLPYHQMKRPAHQLQKIQDGKRCKNYTPESVREDEYSPYSIDGIEKNLPPSSYLMLSLSPLFSDFDEVVMVDDLVYTIT